MKNPPEIFIMDNNQNGLSRLSLALQKDGYHTVCADDRADESQLLESNSPDLILLNVIDSGEYACELCKNLEDKGLIPGIPVILFVAKDGITDKIKELDKYSIDYITKPFQYSELLVRIRNHLKFKAIYEENLEYSRELMNSQKLTSVTALAGEIAHKMNNLIGAVIGYASILQIEIGGDETAYGYTQKVLEASQQIADLTRNLLNYAREGRGVSSRVNINDLLKRMVRLYKNRHKSQDLVKLEISEDELDVYGNQDMILLALANIFNKAQEAIPDDGIVTITASKGKLPESYQFGQPESGNLDYAVISISDNGPDMDEETVERIFEPIFTMKQASGNGFDLSAACCIIQKHKGAICLNTGRGEGSKFHIYLPLLQGDEYGHQHNSSGG